MNHKTYCEYCCDEQGLKAYQDLKGHWVHICDQCLNDCNEPHQEDEQEDI